jgi:hypothetical protein
MLGLRLALTGFERVKTSRCGLGDGRGGESGVMWLVKGVGRVWFGLEANRQREMGYEAWTCPLNDLTQNADQGSYIPQTRGGFEPSRYILLGTTFY